MTVRKAIIPAAGLGTRFLPATKAVPKEMLPIVDKPAIQWVVEELLESGIEDVVLISGRGKEAIEDHFDRAYELEDVLERRGKRALLDQTARVSGMARTISIRQKAPLGLGHAVLCGQPAIGDETFAVLLPDDLFEAETPVTRQLLDAHAKTGKGVVALIEVPRDQTNRYGVIRGEHLGDGLYRIDDLVEKPAPEDAPSNLAIPGRYVLPARLFDVLAKTPPGHGGEIQLTDGLAALAREEGLYGLLIEGRRHDTGNVLGYLGANLSFALKRADLADRLRALMTELLDA